MAQTVVGLDIGTDSIKLTRLQTTLLRFEFVDYAEHPLPGNVDLPWEQLVQSLLRVIFAEGGARTEKVIASIPGHHVSTRVLRLPFSDRKKIAQTLPFEIEGLIPLPLENVLLDYQVLDTDPEGTRVLVLTTNKAIVQTHLSLLREAGVDPHTLVPPPVALANLWKEISAEDENPYAILDMGEGQTSLSVVRKGVFLYGRTWALGSAVLTQALQETFDLSPAQARERKEKEADLAPPKTPDRGEEDRRLQAALIGALAPTVASLRQTLLGFNRTSDLPVERVYLCGKASRLRGLGAHLAREIGMQVTPLALRGPVGSLLASGGHDAVAASTSLGLAYHGVREMAASKLNLRTGDYTFVSEREELKRELVPAGVMLAVLLVMTFAFFGLQYRVRSQAYASLTRSLDQTALETFPELRNLPAGLARASAMKTRLEQAQRERDLFAPLAPESTSVLDVLLALTTAVPKDVQIDVKELILEGDKVQIEGETDSYNAAEQIKENLLASDLVVAADIPEAKDSLDQTKVKFKMKVQLAQSIL